MTAQGDGVGGTGILTQPTEKTAPEVDIEDPWMALAVLVFMGHYRDTAAGTDSGAEFAGHAVDLAFGVAFQEMVTAIARERHPFFVVGIALGDGFRKHIAQGQGQAVEQIEEEDPADPA